MDDSLFEPMFDCSAVSQDFEFSTLELLSKEIAIHAERYLIEYKDGSSMAVDSATAHEALLSAKAPDNKELLRVYRIS